MSCSWFSTVVESGQNLQNKRSEMEVMITCVILIKAHSCTYERNGCVSSTPRQGKKAKRSALLARIHVTAEE